LAAAVIKGETAARKARDRVRLGIGGRKCPYLVASVPNLFWLLWMRLNHAFELNEVRGRVKGARRLRCKRLPRQLLRSWLATGEMVVP
jgi:hypothetical protein